MVTIRPDFLRDRVRFHHSHKTGEAVEYKDVLYDLVHEIPSLPRERFEHPRFSVEEFYISRRNQTIVFVVDRDQDEEKVHGPYVKEE